MPPAIPTSHAPRLPAPRGPLSEAVLGAIVGPAGPTGWPAAAASSDGLADDLQLALYACYELHYRSFAGVDPGWEWEPSLIRFRVELERELLSAVSGLVGERQGVPPHELGAELFRLAGAGDGPSLAGHLETVGTVEQFRELVIHRSAYQLKEADPHTWAIPRLDGGAKAAMVEIQADEYGSGDPDRVHATLFARSMRALDLDPGYGAYLDRIPGFTLATVNLISALGLNRRWRGALVGHLAMFEITSPIPNGRYAKALRRFGLDGAATEFYDEHVEADSVHENIAAYDLAQGLATQEPELADQILFGAEALLALDGVFAARLLQSWARGQSSLGDYAALRTLAGAGSDRGALSAANPVSL